MAQTAGAAGAIAGILNGAFVSNLTGMSLTTITDIITLPEPGANQANVNVVFNAANELTHVRNIVRVELVALMLMCAFSNRMAVKQHADAAIRANADVLRIIQSKFWIMNDINFSALVSGGFLVAAAGAFAGTAIVNAITVKYGGTNVWNFNLVSVSPIRANILRQWMSRHTQNEFNQCVNRLNGTGVDNMASVQL